MAETESSAPPMSISPTRRQLLESLRAQHLQIPDLQSLFRHWPQAVNPHVERLRLLVPNKLASLYSSSSKLQELNKADFGLFGASYWPTASFEAVQILTWVAIWLFVWDDEVNDELDGSAEQLSRAERLREETLLYLKISLGILSAPATQCANSDDQRETLDKDPLSPILSFFKPIEEVVRERYTLEQRKRLLQELEYYMETAHMEQKRRDSPCLPSLADYAACRMGSSAVGVILAFDEYAQDVTLSAEIMTRPSMSVLWEEANNIIWIVNDLLSLKKELERATLDSLIPILYKEYGNLPDAVVESVRMIENSIKRFDEAAEEMLHECEQDVELTPKLRRYIEACRYNCTGNLYWSLCTGRYGVNGTNTEGGVEIKLQN